MTRPWDVTSVSPMMHYRRATAAIAFFGGVAAKGIFQRHSYSETPPHSAQSLLRRRPTQALGRRAAWILLLSIPTVSRYACAPQVRRYFCSSLYLTRWEALMKLRALPPIRQPDLAIRNQRRTSAVPMYRRFFMPDAMCGVNSALWRRCAGSRKARRLPLAGTPTRTPSATFSIGAKWRTPHQRSST